MHGREGGRKKQKKGVRTDPEARETIPPMEGKCDAERQCEYVVSYEIERRAEMLPSLSSQHSTAGTGQAVRDLERGDEGHHLTDEVYDRFVVAEEIPVYLFIFLRLSWEGRGWGDLRLWQGGAIP
jgi:hypothetical protein